MTNDITISREQAEDILNTLTGTYGTWGRHIPQIIDSLINTLSLALYGEPLFEEPAKAKRPDKKNYIVSAVEEPGGRKIGAFSISDNPAMGGTVAEHDHHVEVTIPITFAIGCVRAAGYKIFKEM